MKIILPVVVFLSCALSLSAQDNQFPNELKGYEFFGKVKLQELRLLVSTKADVKRVIGEECEHSCDFDDDWKISFSYVSSNWSKTSGDKLYKPKTEFVGKLWDITFHPKRQILLTEANVFPKEIKCSPGVTVSGGLKYNSRICGDDKRVIYSISNETTSEGNTFVLNQQFIYIGYLPSTKDEEEIYALVDR